MPTSTLQNILAGFKNPGASRTAILQRMNIDPNRAAGYGGNTGYDEKLANLYREGLRTAAELDTQEGNLNRGYQQNLAQAAIDRDKALKAIQGSYAQRGMTFSGANVDEVAENQGNYDRYVANIGADRTAGLGDIGRNRLNLQQGLLAGKQAADTGYGADLSAFLQQQAQDLWNSVVAQNNAQAMLAAASRPAAPTRAAAPRQPMTPLSPRPTQYAIPSYNFAVARKPATSAPRRTPLRGQGYGGRGPF